jgi:hypothetical protein
MLGIYCWNKFIGITENNYFIPCFTSIEHYYFSEGVLLSGKT